MDLVDHYQTAENLQFDLRSTLSTALFLIIHKLFPDLALDKYFRVRKRCALYSYGTESVKKQASRCEECTTDRLNILYDIFYSKTYRHTC